MIRRPKYRLRTRVRGRLPLRLGWLAPKGRADCRGHEWYREDESTWRCYHCAVGASSRSPWSPDEEAAARMGELVETLRYLSHLPQTDETVRDEREVVAALQRSVERRAGTAGV